LRQNRKVFNELQAFVLTATFYWDTVYVHV